MSASRKEFALLQSRHFLMSEECSDGDMNSPSERLQSYGKETAPMNELYADQFNEVKRILVNSGLFTMAVIDRTALDYYRNLGLNEYYFATSTPEAVAEHIKVSSSRHVSYFLLFSVHRCCQCLT